MKKLLEFGIPAWPVGDDRWSDIDGLQWRVVIFQMSLGLPIPEIVGDRQVALNKAKQYRERGYQSTVEVSRDHGVTWIEMLQE